LFIFIPSPAGEG